MNYCKLQITVSFPLDYICGDIFFWAGVCGHYIPHFDYLIKVWVDLNYKKWKLDTFCKLGQTGRGASCRQSNTSRRSNRYANVLCKLPHRFAHLFPFHFFNLFRFSAVWRYQWGSNSVHSDWCSCDAGQRGGHLLVQSLPEWRGHHWHRPRGLSRENRLKVG